MATFIEQLKHYKQDRIPIHGPTGFGTGVQRISDDRKLNIRLQEPEFSRTALRSEIGQEIAREVLLDQFKAGSAYILTPTWVRDSALKGVNQNWQTEARELNEKGIEIALSVKAEAAAYNIYLPVGGDIGPVLDSHSPKVDPGQISAQQIEDQHYRKALQLAPYTDWIHFETISTGYEARVVVDVAKQILHKTGKQSVLSFTPGENGDLRDGAALKEITRLVGNSPAIAAYGINCVPLAWVPKPMDELLTTGKPVIVAPNGPGEHEQNANGDLNWKLVHEATVARRFALDLLELTKSDGATVASACCGTTSSPHGLAINEVFQQAQRKTRRSAMPVNLTFAQRLGFATA